MGLFGPGRKFSRIKTEEERYFSNQGRRNAEAGAALPASADRTQAPYAERQQTAVNPNRVTKIGTLRKTGPRQFETEGWEIEVNDGSMSERRVEAGVRHNGDLAGFTVQQLCAMAHGNNCRCTR